MSNETLRINEIFLSIQGESTWAGYPCVFVRLTGCHLRCTYCDTEYAFREGQARTIEDLVEDVCSFKTDLVEITGGEPLLQKRVHDVIRLLCNAGKTVLIETSGAVDISSCDPRAIRIVDFKTPGSGEVQRNCWRNVEHLHERDEVKFVITDRPDYDWARSIIDKHDLTSRCGAVLMSPVFEQACGSEIEGCDGLEPQWLAEWLLKDPPTSGPVRLQVQMHKHIWHPQTRGV